MFTESKPVTLSLILAFKRGKTEKFLKTVVNIRPLFFSGLFLELADPDFIFEESFFSKAENDQDMQRAMFNGALNYLFKRIYPTEAAQLILDQRKYHLALLFEKRLFRGDATAIFSGVPFGAPEKVFENSKNLMENGTEEVVSWWTNREPHRSSIPFDPTTVFDFFTFSVVYLPGGQHNFKVNVPIAFLADDSLLTVTREDYAALLYGSEWMKAEKQIEDGKMDLRDRLLSLALSLLVTELSPSVIREAIVNDDRCYVNVAINGAGNNKGAVFLLEKELVSGLFWVTSYQRLFKGQDTKVIPLE